MQSPKLSSTPVKRLGTGRRKSSPMTPSFTKLLKNTVADVHTPVSSKAAQLVFTPNKLHQSLNNIEKKDENDAMETPKTVNCRDEFTELELKLQHLEDVSQLEEAIEVWRCGCKEALLQLQALLRDEHDLRMTCKQLSRKLGIWSVIQENYQGDSQVISDEESSD